MRKRYGGLVINEHAVTRYSERIEARNRTRDVIRAEVTQAGLVEKDWLVQAGLADPRNPYFRSRLFALYADRLYVLQRNGKGRHLKVITVVHLTPGQVMTLKTFFGR